MDSELPVGVVGGCATRIIHDQLVRPAVTSVEGRPTPLPAGYLSAEKAFSEAVARFGDKAFGIAASGFLAAASHLQISGTYAETFRHDRVIAYHNAAIAYEEANTVDEARRELGRRAELDPSCAAEIERIIRRLDTNGCP
jgi:hypothetical protein